MRFNVGSGMLWLLAMAGGAAAQTAMAPAVPVSPAPGAVVTLRAAAGNSADGSGAALKPPAPETPAPVAPSAAPAPTRAPDVILMRISSVNGVQRATLNVKGVTRAGLRVGDRVLKQVVSEFRDDGLCLDASLQQPRCATFVSFRYE